MWFHALLDCSCCGSFSSRTSRDGAPGRVTAGKQGRPRSVAGNIVTVASDGSLRIRPLAIQGEELRNRLEGIFAVRSERVAFLQGDRSSEFQAVGQILDLMHTAGAISVGLVTSELEKNR